MKNNNNIAIQKPSEFDIEITGFETLDDKRIYLSFIAPDGFEVFIPQNAKLLIGEHQQFQCRVKPWMQECFGETISDDKIERNHRFLEEALELVQANGCTQSEAHQLVDYVFNRPVGELPQEIGGVMVTLAALCLASRQDMHDCAEIELERIWTKIEKIRAKQAAKPKHSPLPE